MRKANRKTLLSLETLEGRTLLSFLPVFAVKDLGLAADVEGVNSLGQVVGSVHAPNDTNYNAAISGLNGGGMAPIMNPSGDSSGYGINNSGQVVGNMNEIYQPDHAFLYSNGVTTDIGTLGGSSSGANAINNFGHIVGASETSDGQFHAFFYDGTMHDIDTLGHTSSMAYAINDNNQIVGRTLAATGSEHAFFYNGVMHDLGTLGGSYSIALGINSTGQVVGMSWTSDNTGNNDGEHAFVSDPNGGGLHDIGAPQGGVTSTALSINSTGQVVGQYWGPERRDGGFYYNGSTIMDLDLLIQPNSGFTITSASGINDANQIAASGKDSNGLSHALLLTQIPPVPPQIAWANPADIVYGTPLSATQLNATSSVPGTFTYNVAAGTVLHAGAAQTLTATFTPDDTTDYTTATVEVSINVLKAPLTVTANNAQVRYPFAIPPLTGTITGLVNGDTDVATYTTTAVQGSWAGYYPIVPHLTDPNYNITFVNGTLTIYWSIPPGGW